jgi:hypothetical protein
MGKHSGLVLPMAMVLCGWALAAPGCSSTQLPGSDCGSLIEEYNAAFAAARTCTPTLNIAQCSQLASASLQCPNCAVHVTDTTRLDAISAAFRARTDCPQAPCPAIFCINPGNSGACVANDGGSAGSCVDVHTP